MKKKQLHNPILPGFYPDPSICRVEDDFYMITSSFSLFPGVPIFHSTDLVNWEQIGHILDRKSQLHTTADHMTAGIMAPTLRYNNGTFYMITTNVSNKWNFIVTASDPRGPWSDPYWLQDCPGIDSSLFFDDDGKAYITGTRQETNEDGTHGEQVIWISEMDLDNMRLMGGKRTIWGGALKNCASPEAPHLYKKDDFYYLVIAEGGTEHYHAVTVARSRHIFDDYEGYVGNPVITHRHLGKHYPICNVGHADFVELKSGEWYAVMLGSRLIEGYHKNLGRETFIAPVVWEDGFPVISPGTGKIEWSYPAPDLPSFTPKTTPIRDDFDGEKLGFDWVFFGTPYEDFYKVSDSKLTMKLLPRRISQELRKIDLSTTFIDKAVPSLSFIGRRQQHPSFHISVRMHYHALSENETVGLVVMQAANHQFRLERSLKKGKQILRLIQCTSELNGYPHQPHFKGVTTETELASVAVDSKDIILSIIAEGQTYSFYYSKPDGRSNLLYENADGRKINPEIVGGMVGTMVGMFASSNGKESENFVEFDWFEYKGTEHLDYKR
ncbi:glycoside hydrolase family 43 protein [Alkalihalobacillus sp. MEB130]|uniref:glycoside hydrolase family 43 protein n=1 Tax=Alkalihalobacillus sp. MEB130 TaxID=2976704 RepID=UPI0028DE2A0E|nr:glycoside hydrolase family 43 protein [Alkalihalobacillus sp. MEB130]MDT8860219.1 glycoside hydrolase family 43 protein [Alkalihalobacillus sp. MEB130]